jgi:A/G-specific adenine glycosylase
VATFDGLPALAAASNAELMTVEGVTRIHRAPVRDSLAHLAAAAEPVSPARSAIVAEVLAWYAAHARPLPWRDLDAPWGVMVSEFMLQQTPVARVLPVWQRGWPAGPPRPRSPPRSRARPSAPGDASATRAGHSGCTQPPAPSATSTAARCPPTDAALLALPGVGEYTAAAIASFAFGQRHLVLDTNVRRVLARVEAVTEFPADHLTRAERGRAWEWLPEQPAGGLRRGRRPRWSSGALVCTASSPACPRCPVRASTARGRPPAAHRTTARLGVGQTYAGTDRQCRGVLLAPSSPNRIFSARVLDLALDGAAQRAGTQHRIEAALGDQRLGAVGELDAHVACP